MLAVCYLCRDDVSSWSLSSLVALPPPVRRWPPASQLRTACWFSASTFILQHHPAPPALTANIKPDSRYDGDMRTQSNHKPGEREVTKPRTKRISPGRSVSLSQRGEVWQISFIKLKKMFYLTFLSWHLVKLALIGINRYLDPGIELPTPSYPGWSEREGEVNPSLVSGCQKCQPDRMTAMPILDKNKMLQSRLPDSQLSVETGWSRLLIPSWSLTK